MSVTTFLYGSGRAEGEFHRPGRFRGTFLTPQNCKLLKFRELSKFTKEAFSGSSRIWKFGKKRNVVDCAQLSKIGGRGFTSQPFRFKPGKCVFYPWV